MFDDSHGDDQMGINSDQLIMGEVLDMEADYIFTLSRGLLCHAGTTSGVSCGCMVPAISAIYLVSGVAVI